MICEIICTFTCLRVHYDQRSSAKIKGDPMASSIPTNGNGIILKTHSSFLINVLKSRKCNRKRCHFVSGICLACWLMQWLEKRGRHLFICKLWSRLKYCFFRLCLRLRILPFQIQPSRFARSSLAILWSATAVNQTSIWNLMICVLHLQAFLFWQVVYLATFLIT